MADLWDVRGLRVAREVAGWSKDPSTKVGCYIADAEHRPLSFGFNGFPRGIADDSRLYDRETKYEMIIHAEANAILNTLAPMNGATAYCWPFQPCTQCAGFLIQKGIARIVTLPNENPRWEDNYRKSKRLLEEAGVAMVLLTPLSLH